MTVMQKPTFAPTGSGDVWSGEAKLAAAAFLARYSGRTLEAYRHVLRTFLQWATDVRVDVLAATRPHIELYRTTLEGRELAASTIDSRPCVASIGSHISMVASARTPHSLCDGRPCT